MRRAVAVAALLGAALLTAAAQAQDSSLRERMRNAEDGRAATLAEMAPILQGLRSTDPRLLTQAVRAIGRLERPALIKELLPLVTHARPDVRADVVNALGQSLAASSEVLPAEAAIVTNALLARLKAEADPYVAGVTAETLGRLPFRTAASVRAAEEALTALLPVTEGAAPLRPGAEPVARVVHPATVMGAVKGLETRIRVYQKLEPAAAATLVRLKGAATLGSDPSDADLAFVRRVAWAALNGARAADPQLVERGFDDPDPQVRRLAALALDYVESNRLGSLTRALRDGSPMVRYDALRVYSRTLQKSNCTPVLTAVKDASAHVALAALDALGDGCPAGPSPIPTLLHEADQLPPDGADWHRAAHAFVSLARLAPDHAAGRMPKFGEHPVWQVRMYAARAAAAMLAEARLERLAGDRHDNVSEAALTGLLATRRHDADRLFIAALARKDYQLVRTAANALKGSPNGRDAAPALVAAFTRITAERRDTSRDPRMAILERLQELGNKDQAASLRPCLSDFDPPVAAQCAAILRTWTGTAHTAKPAARPVAPVVVPAARRARIAMRRGGTFELRLFVDDAPATVARFVQLARRGYYNGLTFHRVVPNFVIQGGSPGANEYVGDGPYMRDEVALRTHARGTLGISTRGRDTGDAQIFVNLVDNPRLDHNYTVFAEVTAGMNVVDAIVEGDVIARVDVLEPPSSQSGR